MSEKKVYKKYALINIYTSSEECYGNSLTEVNLVFNNIKPNSYGRYEYYNRYFNTEEEAVNYMVEKDLCGQYIVIPVYSLTESLLDC